MPNIIPRPIRVNNRVVPVFDELDDALEYAGPLCVLAEPRNGLAEISWVGAPPGTRTALEDLVRRESLYGTQGFYGDSGLIRDVPLSRVKVVCSTICDITGIRP